LLLLIIICNNASSIVGEEPVTKLTGESCCCFWFLCSAKRLSSEDRMQYEQLRSSGPYRKNLLLIGLNQNREPILSQQPFWTLSRGILA
jgi:hypothetical protein